MKTKEFIKKAVYLLCICIFSFSIVWADGFTADAFTDVIQDLAVQTACLGEYALAEAGRDPSGDIGNYYVPKMMAERFQHMSGVMTRINTFYGVCFDYAQFAYNDIKSYTQLYIDAGMYEGQFLIASVDDNPNKIKLLSPVSSAETNLKHNGVPVKETKMHSVKTHKISDGVRATNHAWLWIQRNDGVWFWIDPTWTDNLGYVVWGYVDGKEEVQCRPDKDYCIKYPDYLNNLPLPPPSVKRKSSDNPAKTASTNSTESSTQTVNSKGAESFISIGFSTPVHNMFRDKQMGFSFSWEDGNRYPKHIIGMIQADYFSYKDKAAMLIGGDMGYQFNKVFALYGGGGIGHSVPRANLFDFTDFTGKRRFAWKVNGGLRTSFGKLSARCDVAYINGPGLALGVFIGIGF